MGVSGYPFTKKSKTVSTYPKCSGQVDTSPNLPSCKKTLLHEDILGNICYITALHIDCLKLRQKVYQKDISSRQG